MGWTTDLLTGLAEHLDANDVGTWRPTGAYQPDEIAIVIRAIPQTPDRLITLSAYPLDSTANRGMADHDTAVQIRIRGNADPRVADDLADAVFDLLDSATGQRFSDIPVIDVWRQSYTSLGADTNGRWERSENYYLSTMRPTANKTD